MAREKTFSDKIGDIAPVAAMGTASLLTMIPVWGQTLPLWSVPAIVLYATVAKINTIKKIQGINEQQKSSYIKSELLSLALDAMVAGTVYQLGATALTTVGVLSAWPAAAALISYCGFKLLYSGINSPLDHIKADVSGRNDLINNQSRERRDFWSAIKTNGVESATTLFYSLFGAGTQTSIPLVYGYSLPIFPKPWAALSVFGICSASYRANAKHTDDNSIAIKEIIKNCATILAGLVLASLSGAYIAPIILGAVAAAITSRGDNSYADQLFGGQVQQRGEQPGAAVVLH
jgi:hypothetical protein